MVGRWRLRTQGRRHVVLSPNLRAHEVSEVAGRVLVVPKKLEDGDEVDCLVERGWHAARRDLFGPWLGWESEEAGTSEAKRAAREGIEGLDPGTDLELRRAVLMEDAASPGTICVEIKPKSGVPRSLSNDTMFRWMHMAGLRSGISDGSIPAWWDPYRALSTFQLRQILKTQDRQVACRSGYDPLDLYSGDLSRTSLAIDELRQNPQNNLRVFVDGIEISLMSSLCVDKEVHSCISQTPEILIRSGVLQRMRELQRLSARTDVEHTIEAHRQLSASLSSNNETNCRETVATDWRAVVENGEPASHSGAVLLLHRLRQYCLSRLADDVSVMLRFERGNRDKLDLSKLIIVDTLSLKRSSAAPSILQKELRALKLFAETRAVG